MVWKYALLAASVIWLWCRIGEASNPGPAVSTSTSPTAAAAAAAPLPAFAAAAWDDGSEDSEPESVRQAMGDDTPWVEPPRMTTT